MNRNNWVGGAKHEPIPEPPTVEETLKEVEKNVITNEGVVQRMDFNDRLARALEGINDRPEEAQKLLDELNEIQSE